MKSIFKIAAASLGLAAIAATSIPACQQRITTTLQRRDGRAVHVRKATRSEPHQQKIIDILALPANPGGTHRAVI
jgi:2-phospho-L-lactate transferase/gluconeogenesis factor (CofD/UPF0052 family)